MHLVEWPGGQAELYRNRNVSDNAEVATDAGKTSAYQRRGDHTGTKNTDCLIELLANKPEVVQEQKSQTTVVVVAH